MSPVGDGRREVRSSDGTQLHVERRGPGRPVVLVHGTLGNWTDWSKVLDRLSDRFLVAAYDRRGRGRSADGASYAIAREVDDAVAVITSVGAPVHLVGHSFGAIVALLVAARHPGLIDKLVVYEPPIGSSGSDGNAFLRELDAAVNEGALDDAVVVFLRATGATESEVADTRSNGSAWAAMREAIGTVGREVRAAAEVLPLGPEEVGQISMPTLVLLGAEQDAATYAGVEDLARQLANGELRHVPGRHLALIREPDAFVATINEFFAQPSEAVPSI
jgi:pimeloyl-ACP methyl ester carboxylesterase